MIKIKSSEFLRNTVLFGVTVLLAVTSELLNILGGSYCEAAISVILFAIILQNIAIFCDLLTNIRRDFPLFVFVSAFNVLLLGRVYVSYFGHYSLLLLLLEADSYANLFISLRIIMISLFSVYLAYRLAGPIFYKREKAIQNDGIKLVKTNSVTPIIRQLSVAVLLVSSIAFFYTLFQTVINVLKHGYLSSFTNTTQIPSSISRLSMFFIPAFAVFLATLPNKKQMKLPLAIYGLYMFTSVFTGRRNTLVTEALMLLIYFVMRDNLLEPDKRVLKKKTVAYMGVLSIVSMYLLQLFAILRAGIADASKGVGAMIVSFFDSQGASFRVVIQTVNNLHRFNPATSYQYLFYPFELFVHNNIITRSLFGLTPIIEVQNSQFVQTTHNYGHALTYAVDPDRYLSGGGFGTSYVAEAYVAYGILGVIAVSLMIGFIFRFFSSMLTRSWVVIACCLLAIKGFVYIPRSLTFIWVTDVFNITYLCFYGAIYLIALFILKTATHLRVSQSAAPPFALEEKL